MRSQHERQLDDGSISGHDGTRHAARWYVTPPISARRRRCPIGDTLDDDTRITCHCYRSWSIPEASLAMASARFRHFNGSHYLFRTAACHEWALAAPSSPATDFRCRRLALNLVKNASITRSHFAVAHINVTSGAKGLTKSTARILSSRLTRENT